jgi:predicted enzyme related to lactoylglutathione lyase
MFEKLLVKQPPRPHVSGKVRAYGRARIEIAQRAITPQDWDELWKPPQNPFPFTWGKYWKQCIEYRVEDFASEVGFFIDVLGLPVIAFDASYAMFTSPTGEFTFAVVQTPEGGYSTPPDAMRIQFMVEDIYETIEELARRGIAFIQNPEPISDGSNMHIATFQTPHGISIDLWGEVQTAIAEVLEPDESEESEEIDETDELEDYEDSVEEEVKVELPKHPTVKKSFDEEDDFDDLFEEIQDEPDPKVKPATQKKPLPKPIKVEEPEDESSEEIQYVDEPETKYTAYKPIPVRGSGTP